MRGQSLMQRPKILPILELPPISTASEESPSKRQRRDSFASDVQQSPSLSPESLALPQRRETANVAVADQSSAVLPTACATGARNQSNAAARRAESAGPLRDVRVPRVSASLPDSSNGQNATVGSTASKTLALTAMPDQPPPSAPPPTAAQQTVTSALHHVAEAPDHGTSSPAASTKSAHHTMAGTAHAVLAMTSLPARLPPIGEGQARQASLQSPQPTRGLSPVPLSKLPSVKENAALDTQTLVSAAPQVATGTALGPQDMSDRYKSLPRPSMLGKFSASMREAASMHTFRSSFTAWGQGSMRRSLLRQQASGSMLEGTVLCSHESSSSSAFSAVFGQTSKLVRWLTGSMHETSEGEAAGNTDDEPRPRRLGKQKTFGSVRTRR